MFLLIHFPSSLYEIVFFLWLTTCILMILNYLLKNQIWYRHGKKNWGCWVSKTQGWGESHQTLKNFIKDRGGGGDLLTLFFNRYALKYHFGSKQYLELIYRAEILIQYWLSRALGYVFFDIRIQNPTMDAEKSNPVKHTRKMKYLLNITIFTYFMS